VFFRYGLNAPLVWTEEALRYLMIWVALLGAAAAVTRDEHMAVDLLGLAAPPWLRRVQRVVVLLLIAGFSALLLLHAWPMAVRNMAQVSPAARIPMVWPYAALVVGAGLMLIKALGLLALTLMGAASRFEDETDVPVRE
jgi:TRAP-type C4-dicarboxylate transport system permease small subunit